MCSLPFTFSSLPPLPSPSLHAWSLYTINTDRFYVSSASASLLLLFSPSNSRHLGGALTPHQTTLHPRLILLLPDCLSLYSHYRSFSDAEVISTGIAHPNGPPPVTLPICHRTSLCSHSTCILPLVQLPRLAVIYLSSAALFYSYVCFL